MHAAQAQTQRGIEFRATSKLRLINAIQIDYHDPIL